MTCAILTVADFVARTLYDHCNLHQRKSSPLFFFVLQLQVNLLSASSPLQLNCLSTMELCLNRATYFPRNCFSRNHTALNLPTHLASIMDSTSMRLSTPSKTHRDASQH